MKAFELPIPPSTNNLTATIVRGKHSRRVKTQEYRDWLQEAGLTLKLQGVKPVPSPVRIGVSIIPGAGMNRQRDCDNFLKAICDFLVTAGIIEGDNLRHVVGVEAEFIRVGGKPGLYVGPGRAYCLVEIIEAAKETIQ
jgi:Holliday junction resolvase RusA-like endonuclease